MNTATSMTRVNKVMSRVDILPSGRTGDTLHISLLYYHILSEKSSYNVNKSDYYKRCRPEGSTHVADAEASTLYKSSTSSCCIPTGARLLSGFEANSTKLAACRG